MQLTEESMQVVEAGIPELVRVAFQRAYHEALKTTGKAMRAVDGKLVETYADRTEIVIRTINSPVKVKMGARFKLKPRVSPT